MSGQQQSPPEQGVTLAPRTMATMFETTIRFVRRQPRTVFGLGAIAGFSSALANLVGLGTVYDQIQDRLAVVEPLAADPQAADQTFLAQALVDLLASVSGMLIMVSLLSLPVAALVNAMVISTLGRAAVGDRTSIGQAWTSVRRMSGRILTQALMIVILLAVCGLPVVVALGMAGRNPVLGLGLAMLMAPLCLVAILMLTPRLMLAPVCLVLEDLSVGASFVRARLLARGDSLRVLGIGIAALLISRLLSTVVSLPFAVFAGGEPLSTQAVFFTSLARMAGTAVSLPILATLIALVYVDLRVRKEGLGQPTMPA